MEIPDSGLRWLFLFAHPDDEISVAAWMRRCGGVAWWAHSTPVRQQESERVLDRLGVSILGFGNFPDGAFTYHLMDLRREVSAVLERFQPEVVATLSFEHGHADHDALNWATRQVWDGMLVEIPIYRPAPIGLAIQSFALGHGVEVALTPEERDLKWELSYAYPSQRLGWWLRGHAALTGNRQRPASTLALERLRLQPSLDYLQPNASQVVAGRIRKSRRWRDWRSALHAINS